MSENGTNDAGENLNNDDVENGAAAAGKPDEQDSGGYGGPGPEAEVAPGFETEDDR